MEQDHKGAVMGATKGASPASRRTEYLHALADRALAEEDAKKAILTNAEAEAEDALARRVKLGIMARKHKDARLKDTAAAERAVKDFIAAVGGILSAADSERKALAGLGEASGAINPNAIMRRLGRYLSHDLRPIGAHSRFGEITLARYFPLGATNWLEAEKRATAGLTISSNGEIRDE